MAAFDAFPPQNEGNRKACRIGDGGLVSHFSQIHHAPWSTCLKISKAFLNTLYRLCINSWAHVSNPSPVASETRPPQHKDEHPDARTLPVSSRAAVLNLGHPCPHALSLYQANTFTLPAGVMPQRRPLSAPICFLLPLGPFHHLMVTDQLTRGHWMDSKKISLSSTLQLAWSHSSPKTFTLFVAQIPLLMVPSNLVHTTAHSKRQTLHLEGEGPFALELDNRLNFFQK